MLIVVFVAIAPPAGAQEPGPSRGVLPAPPTAPPRPASSYVGAVLVDNSPGWAQLIDRSDSNGPLVTVVLPGSPAAEAGIVAGDVIVAIDGDQVHDVEQARVALERSTGPRHVVTVTKPGGAVRIVPIRPLASARVDVGDVLARRLVSAPDAVSRFMFAKTTGDPLVARRLAEQVIAEAPGFAQARALRASAILQAGRSQRRAATDSEKQVARAEVATAVELDAGALEVRLPRRPHIRQPGRAAPRRSARGPGGGGTPALGCCSPPARERSPGQRTRRRSGERVAPGGRAEPVPSRLLPVAGPCVPCGRGAPPGSSDGSGLARAIEPRGERGRPRRLGGADPPRIHGTARPGRRRGRRGAPARRGARTRSGHDRGFTTAAVRLGIVEGLVALAALSATVPYLGPVFGLAAEVSGKVAITDHVVPGGAVVVLGAVALWLLLGPDPSPSRFFSWAPMCMVLCAIWMLVTHAVLFRRAAEHSVPWTLAVFHATPALAVLALALSLYRRVTPPRPVSGRTEARADPA